LRHVARRASPLVAKCVSAHVAVTDRGGQRAREQDKGRTAVVPTWCEPAVEPRRVSSAGDHDDHCTGDDDDDHCTGDDDDDRATTAGDHDDDGAAAAASSHHDHDNGTAASGGDEQRRR
jgi:hypothetical protein